MLSSFQITNPIVLKIILRNIQNPVKNPDPLNQSGLRVETGDGGEIITILEPGDAPVLVVIRRAALPPDRLIGGIAHFD